MKILSAKKTDPNFKNEVAAQPGGENLRLCFSCGTCTATCPVFHVESGYNPRKLIRMILLGMRKEVLSSKSIWLCARCYACTAHCPQNVSFADILVVLRDMAVREGYAPRELPEMVEQISDAAHAFRRDCIHLITGAPAPSREEIAAFAQKTVESLQTPRKPS